MPWYLGRPGSIIQLPAPSRGTQTPYERLGGTHQLLSGGRVRDSFGVKRSWQFTWQALTQDQVGILNGFVYGTVGPGPYVLLDPEQRNLLSANVASGGDATGDATGFTFGGGVTGSAAPDVNFNPGGRLAIVLHESTAVVAFQDLVVGVDYIPVVPGFSYTFSTYLWVNTGCPGHYAEIFWYDITKTGIGNNGGNIVTAPATQVRSVVTATAPAGAAYAQVRVQASTANTSGSTQFADTDGWQFEQASAVSPWVPGLGVPYVTVDVPGRSRQQTNQNDYSLTLVEV